MQDGRLDIDELRLLLQTLGQELGDAEVSLKNV